jgi:2-dehydro-3-deoxy-D-pentonate aldolase
MNLHGIIPPIVTPLLDRDTLDMLGLHRLIDHLLAGGVHGLFVLGTTGEAPSLSYRLRREMIDAVCKRVQQRIPVLVGITDTAFAESVALAEHAAQAGADAVVFTAPYYFPVGQAELLEYTRALVDAVLLPVILYNMPMMTKVTFEIGTLAQLVDSPRILGIKDSGGDIDYFLQTLKLREQRPDWLSFIGPEHLLISATQSGGNGGVAGGANLFPHLYVNAYEAARANDAQKMATCQAEIDRVQTLYQVGQHASRIIKAIKCGLSLMEICDDFMAEPFHRFNAPEREKIRAILQTLNPDPSL